MIEHSYPELVGVELVYHIPVEYLQNLDDSILLKNPDILLQVFRDDYSHLGGVYEVSDQNLLTALGLIREQEIASTSRTNLVHIVTERRVSNDTWIAVHCTCEGFAYRGTCKHC